MAYESDWSSLKDISLPDLRLAGGSIKDSSENRFVNVANQKIIQHHCFVRA